jgi:cytochrome P450
MPGSSRVAENVIIDVAMAYTRKATAAHHAIDVASMKCSNMTMAIIASLLGFEY